MISERVNDVDVAGHGVVSEEAPDDLGKPSPLLGDWVMPALSQLLLDLPEPRVHTVPPGFPLNLELALACRAADECEAEKGEGLRFGLPALRAPSCCEAAELDQARLLWVQVERKRRQPRPQIGEEAFGVSSVLEADDGIVRLAHEDTIAGRMALPPLMGPQVVDVMKVDVRQER